MIENTNTKQFYPGPILNNTLEITDFLFNDAEQIKIKHSKLNEEGVLIDIDLDYPIDYEVTKILPSDIDVTEAALTASTGQVLLKNVNVLAGEKLTVYRVSQIIQDMDYPRTGAFPAASHEGALDYLTMQNQEQQEQINRALKIPNSVETFDAQMPTPLPARTLKINADGTGFELSEFDPDVALITTEEFKNQAQQAAIEALASQNIATEQATIATNKTSEVVTSGNDALSNIGTAKSEALTEIETLHSSSVDDITNLKNTSISNITTAKNNAITSITNKETTSKNNIINEGATQVANVNSAGTTQINLAKEQATLATNQANIATEQATIATSQASIATSKTTEVVESGNTALSNIETAKSNALNDINITGAEYVNNAKQYAQNALNSANNAKTSEDNALSYKNSAQESSQTATQQASIAVTNANKAATSATNAKTSETNAKSSETRCEEILSRLGTAIKIKGRVNNLDDLPLSGNLDGDAYLVGQEGLDSYPEYYWYQDHWEFLGTSGTTLSWGLITGNITAQTDLQTALNNKQDKGNYALKSEIPTNNNQLANGAGYITSSYHDSTKQDVITDLATIRSGASKGATALQSYTETDPVYTADKPNIANINLNNLSEAGLKVIKDNSGGGLEVGDISMALYVDETKGLRRYLNGQIVDINTNTQAFLNRLLEIKNTNPDYFATEDNWQAEALLNIDGCVYKFVLNYSGETVVSVRLPKYPDYVEINAGGTLPVVGNGTAVGLNNGSTFAGLGSVSGGTGPSVVAYDSIYGKAINSTVTSGNKVIGNLGITTDPTKSGIQTTLKQTKLKLRYFIQIATGSETENNIINEIELNNPFSLFDSKYSDHELNNLSWLKSEGQWNAKAVYTDAYDKLLKVYNGTETVEGLSVKLSTETYTDYDFVLNTTDETFRLPLLDGSEDLPSQKFDNLTLTSSDSIYIAPANGRYYLKMNASTGQFINMHRINASGDDIIISHDVSVNNLDVFEEIKVRKGDKVHITHNTSGNVLAFKFIYAQGNGSLYYYVGETVQNANLIDAGRIGEQLANKQDKCIHIIDTYVNGTSGYNIWSNGYCEQWGKIRGSTGAISISLLKIYANLDYNIQTGGIEYTSSTTIYEGTITNKTINGFTYYNAYVNGRYWKTSGYLAEGEY